MEIQELWRILRERWLIIAIVTLLFVLGSLAWYFTRPLEYQAQTRVIVSTSGGTGTAVDAYAGERVAQLRTPSYAELLKGPEVATRASGKLNNEVSPSDIQSAIGTRIAPDQPLINLTAEATNPARALSIAEAVQKSFQEYVAEIERPGATGALTSVEITTDQPTVQPEGHWKRDTIIAGIIGLIVGFVLAVIRDRTDPVIRKPGQLSSTGLPYLGAVDATPASAHDALGVYRRVALECLINSEDPAAARLLVVGVDGESDSLTVARGLADALVSYGKRVTLVNAVGGTNAPGNGPGISDYLAGAAEWNDCLRPGKDNISEIGLGSDGENLDAYFLSGQRSRSPLPLRRNEFALIAGPSIVHTPLAVALTSVADASLLVAGKRSSRIKDVEEAKYTLEAMNTEALGVVLVSSTRRKAKRRKGNDAGSGGDESTATRKGRKDRRDRVGAGTPNR